MPQLDEYLHQLAPAMIQWRRDFHLHAESGWLEFRLSLIHISEPTRPY